MYNLLISFAGWAPRRDSLSDDRIFEYTDDNLSNLFRPRGIIDQSKISNIPALFATEIGGNGDQFAHVGYINKVEIRANKAYIEYQFEPEIPPIPNELLQQISSELSIDGYELSRTHWAIKDVDLFRVLLRNRSIAKVTPKVFTLEEFSRVERDLVSVMMPFASEFDNVYKALQATSKKLALRCLRADDIWEHDAVIQDVVSLIHRSKIVICDCTGRNPNVFYEAGIAHTLGKDVILIAQNQNDIPFDLRHLRYLTYLNNNEGREQLKDKLSERIQTIMG